MVRFNEASGKCWKSELQRLLEREAIATAQVLHREDCLQVTPRDHESGLTFGPYDRSPLKGLHFESADDTAAS